LNGKPRKQLSDQLDRLDEIINGLGECLPEAVADATRDGVRLAFRDVVAELVTDPTILERLRTALEPEIVPVAPEPSPFARLKALARSVAAKAASVFTATKQVVSMAQQRVTAAVAERCAAAKGRVARLLTESLPLKSMAFVGLGVGLTVATISFAAPHHLSAIISGVGAAVSTVAVQVGLT
jgi:hypothetical protein